jgi:hypothetical protein
MRARIQLTFLALFRLVLFATSAEARTCRSFTSAAPSPSESAPSSFIAAGVLPSRSAASVELQHCRFVLGSSSSSASVAVSHPLAWVGHEARALTPCHKRRPPATVKFPHPEHTDAKIGNLIEAAVDAQTFCAAVRVSESCDSDAATESRPRTSISESSRRRFPRSDSTARCERETERVKIHFCARKKETKLNR